MRVIRHVGQARRAKRPLIVAAGQFDGVHVGHRHLLDATVELARAADGDPVVVLARRNRDEPQLLARRDQLDVLRAAEIALVVCCRTESLEATVHHLAPVIRVSAKGCSAVSPQDGKLEEVSIVEVRGAPVLSAAIHAALARGDLAGAAAMLGRAPTVGGRVVHGFHRGRPLGIPTANLRLRGIRLPPDGVYAVRATLDGRRLTGVANVGFNPTFGNQTRTVETHIFDFDGDIYGKRLQVGFLERLRGERKFPDVQALVTQIRADIESARGYFTQHGS